MRALTSLLAGLIALAPAAASAEFQLSIYGGANTVRDDEITFDNGAGPVDYDVEWEGNSFQFPPYYGLRGTYWLDFNHSNWGIAIDYTHAKAYADIDGTIETVFSHLQLTHGLNSVSLNGLYRAPMSDRFTLYAGAGAGASVPHVEVDTLAPVTSTREYQLAGPMVQGLAGASMKVGHGFSLFGEYKAAYSWNDIDLDGGGSLDADVLTNQFAIGVTYSFGGP